MRSLGRRIFRHHRALTTCLNDQTRIDARIPLSDGLDYDTNTLEGERPGDESLSHLHIDNG